MQPVRKVRAAVFSVFVSLILSWCAAAVEPDEILDDPILEERARAISQQLRCLVCQNENIDSSNAGLAKDLRVIVRERLVAGDTDEEIIEFVVERYGDYVLLKPPLKASTLILWLSPILLLGLAGLGAVYVIRANRSLSETKVLSEAEERRVDDLMSPKNEP